MMSLNQTLEELHRAFPYSDQKMPTLFVGHGSPMNALEDNEYTRAWAEIGYGLPQPNAILCISAHWLTRGTHVTGMDHPQTIHDFGGFPRELYEAQYPAPGSPALARLAQETVQKVDVCLDDEWGLDHGTWSVLAQMFPDARIPVVQLSLDYTQKPDFHYALGRELRELRNRGVLIIGSGNIVHHLGMARFVENGETFAYDWAREFDETIKQLIIDRNHDPIVHYQSLGRAARLSVPTNDHYLPLLYALALQDDQEQISFFADKVTYGSLSMRSVLIK
jgi:4,5-DOPA dioxygenase extradiol